VIKGIVLIGIPGSNGNKFMIKTTSINPTILAINLYGKQNYEKYEAFFTVDFRECKEGEEKSNGVC